MVISGFHNNGRQIFVCVKIESLLDLEFPIKCSLMNIQQVSHGVGEKNLYIVIQQCLMSPSVCRDFHRQFIYKFLLPLLQ